MLSDLYHTINGGKAWNAQHISVPTRLKQAHFASCPPVFFNHKDGILPVEVFGGPVVVYRTIYGGVRWTPTTPVSLGKPQAKAQGWNVDFLSMKNGFASDGGRLFTTKNGGQTWDSVKTNMTIKNVKELDFTSYHNGWALLGSGTLYHTVDTGVIWKKMN